MPQEELVYWIFQSTPPKQPMRLLSPPDPTKVDAEVRKKLGWDDAVWKDSYRFFWPLKRRWPEQTILLDDHEDIRFTDEVDIKNEAKTYTVAGEYDPVHPDESQYYTWGVWFNGQEIDTRIPHNFDVPLPIVKFLGLMEGQNVGVSVNDTMHTVTITSINGVDVRNAKGLNKIRQASSIINLDQEFYYDSPVDEIPLWEAAGYEVRMLLSLIAFGFGQGFWLVAQGLAGKTWMQKRLVEAIGNIMEKLQNVFLIIGYVGDRPSDFPTYYLNPVNAMSDAVRKRVFIFQSPWGDDSTRAIRYVHFARNVADCQLRLGCHVIWAHDSLTWTAAHFGFSQYVDLALGMLKQGLPRSVIPHLIQLVFGKYGRLIPRNKKAWDGLERTMTFSCTVLEDPESSVGQLAKEAKDSGTSSFARLLKKANVEKPVIAMDENDTATRYPDGIDPIYGKSYDFRSEATKRWHLLVNCDAWDRAAPFLPANNDADAALEVVRAKVKASLGQTAVDLDRLIFVPDPELNQMLREVAGRYKINPADLLGHLSRFAVTTDEVVTKQGRVLLVGDEVGGDPLYRIKLPNFLPVKIGGESDRKRRRKQDTPGSDGTRS